MSSYRHVIGLGQNCQTKHAILRKAWIDTFGSDTGFHVSSDKLSGPVCSTQFFDWSWSKTPIASVLRVLDARFEIDFSKESIAIVDLSDGRQEVLHTPTGLRYPHEFHRNADGKLDPEVVDRDLPRVAQKLKHLASRTRAVFEGAEPALLVLYCSASKDEVCALVDRIRADYPALRFDLLWVSGDPMGLSFDHQVRVGRRAVRDLPYPGDLDGWFGALSEVRWTSA